MQFILNKLEERGLSGFDALVWLVIAGLLMAIGLTLLMGDRVGVQIVQVAPQDEAHSTEPIVVQFGEAMQRDSVVERFSIEPPIEGDLIWNANTLVFEPDEALLPGTMYRVTIAADAESRTGRRLLADQQFSFTVRRPHVAFLAPTTTFPQNIHIVDPANPADVQQVTDSETSIFDFAVSPDGTRIAFSEYDAEIADINIKLLDLATGNVTALTNCRDATCTNPVWRPDGRAIAYHRVDANSNLPGIGTSPTRIWIVELTNEVYENRPLFDDYQIVGYSPVWSAEGTRIGIYDPLTPGILIYDLTENSIRSIPALSGTMGTLSPDGNRVVFADINPNDTPPITSFLQLADLQSNEIDELTSVDDAIHDTMPAFHPNGRDLAIARRYMDERFTRGSQIYLLDSETGESQPLVVDAEYTHGFISWDATGTQLLFQRFREVDASGQSPQNARTEVWTYDLASEALTQVTADAYLPQWVP